MVNSSQRMDCQAWECLVIIPADVPTGIGLTDQPFVGVVRDLTFYVSRNYGKLGVAFPPRK